MVQMQILEDTLIAPYASHSLQIQVSLEYNNPTSMISSRIDCCCLELHWL